MSVARRQRTLCRPVSVDGFGYFSGRDIRVEFWPPARNAGIIFVRHDIGVTARVPARRALRIDEPRRTTLEWHGIRVEMVEHVLAALAGMRIDNCEVWVDAPEMPGCDGSSQSVRRSDRCGRHCRTASTVRQIVVGAVDASRRRRELDRSPACRGNRLVDFVRLGLRQPPGDRPAAFALDVTPDSFRRELAAVPHVHSGRSGPRACWPKESATA